MARIPFSQVLKNASIDPRKEYDRLFFMFSKKPITDSRETFTLREVCAQNFVNIPFRGTCISLEDFDESYNCHFTENPSNFDIDYLVTFCEYSYNLVYLSRGYAFNYLSSDVNQAIRLYITQIENVIEKICYMPNDKENITDFVPKNQVAISVSEIVDPNLSYKILEYNHHSMKGDIRQKRDVVLTLADQLEPQRAKLKQINSTMESDLFFLFNNLNLRHNNADPNGKNYVSFVAAMKEEEIEQWYDDIYQMCLLAFLELDQIDRKSRVAQLKTDIQNQ